MKMRELHRIDISLSKLRQMMLEMRLKNDILFCNLDQCVLIMKEIKAQQEDEEQERKLDENSRRSLPPIRYANWGEKLERKEVHFADDSHLPSHPSLRLSSRSPSDTIRHSLAPSSPPPIAILRHPPVNRGHDSSKPTRDYRKLAKHCELNDAELSESGTGIDSESSSDMTPTIDRPSTLTDDGTWIGHRYDHRYDHMPPTYNTDNPAPPKPLFIPPTSSSSIGSNRLTRLSRAQSLSDQSAHPSSSSTSSQTSSTFSGSGKPPGLQNRYVSTGSSHQYPAHRPPAAVAALRSHRSFSGDLLSRRANTSANDISRKTSGELSHRNRFSNSFNAADMLSYNSGSFNSSNHGAYNRVTRQSYHVSTSSKGGFGITDGPLVIMDSSMIVTNTALAGQTPPGGRNQFSLIESDFIDGDEWQPDEAMYSSETDILENCLEYLQRKS